MAGEEPAKRVRLALGKNVLRGFDSQEDLEPEELRALLSKSTETKDKDEKLAGEWFIPATFKEENGKRLKENVATMSGLVLDIDKAVTQDEIRNALDGEYYFAHSTYSTGCARVFLPYSRPATLEEHERITARFLADCSLPGLDAVVEKPAQIYFRPQHQPGDAPWAFDTADDPGVEPINPDDFQGPTPATVTPIDQARPLEAVKVPREDYSPERVAELLECIDANDRKVWYEAGMGVYHQFGGSEKGFQLWKHYSDTADEPDGEAELRRKWRSFDPSKLNSEPIGIGKLNYLAKHHPREGASPVQVEPFKPRKFDPDLEPRRRQRVYGNAVFGNTFTIINAKGGLAKSLLSMEIAAGKVLGKDLIKIAGEHEIEPGRALVINNEDDANEMSLRWRAFVQAFELDADDSELLREGLLDLPKGERNIQLAKRRPDGEIVPGADYEPLRAFLEEKQVVLVVIDPLVSVHNANENDNGEMEKVANILRSLVIGTDRGMVVVHHSNKNAENADDASRGASATTNAARKNLHLRRMNEAESKRLAIGSEPRTSYIRVDDGKANYSLPADKATWLHLETVTVACADGEEHIGVAKPVTLHDALDEHPPEWQILDCLIAEKFPVRLADEMDSLMYYLSVTSNEGVRKRIARFPKGREAAEKSGRTYLVGSKKFLAWTELPKGKAGGIYLHREEVR